MPSLFNYLVHGVRAAGRIEPLVVLLQRSGKIDQKILSHRLVLADARNSLDTSYCDSACPKQCCRSDADVHECIVTASKAHFASEFESVPSGAPAEVISKNGQS